VIPYSFNYHRAKTLNEAQALLKQSQDAALLAGGQTLIATMKTRLANPSDLIDISRLQELIFIRTDADSVTIGAATTHAAVAESAAVRHALPALGEMAHLIGDPAVRHLGTIGGSLANNDPAADYPAAVLALNATVKTTGRTIAADEFFTGMFQTALADGEIVTEVQFPLVERAAYTKFRNPASRYAMVGVFVAKTKDGIRVAITGAGPCVFRSAEMEAALAQNFAPEALAEITIDPSDLNSDIHGSAQYRANLVRVMAMRAVAKAVA
jgi:carbon-monoxide dehydrogenase medium subunit